MATYILFNDNFKVEVSSMDNGGQCLEFNPNNQTCKMLIYELKRTFGEIEDIKEEMQKHLTLQNYDAVVDLNGKLINQAKAFNTAKMILERHSNGESFFAILNDLAFQVIEIIGKGREVNISLGFISELKRTVK
jgi:predicted Zn-dependent protease